jgi:RNA polymerase sigma-70 factor (ECF subfamily)
VSNLTTTEPSPTADHHRWFAEEVQPHQSQLRSYLRGTFPTVRDVDDVVQESLLRIWRARAKQTIRSAKDFLFQTGRNVATDAIRRQRASPVDFVADLAGSSVLESSPSAADVVCTREELAVLADAIARLPARCREIVILRKIKRVPQKEIARMLGVSEFTVQNQVSRGMKRCEEYLAARGIKSSASNPKP